MPQESPPPEVFRLTLRSRPSNVPAIIRLRRLLKTLLRLYDFVCVEAVELKPAERSSCDR